MLGDSYLECWYFLSTTTSYSLVLEMPSMPLGLPLNPCCWDRFLKSPWFAHNQKPATLPITAMSAKRDFKTTKNKRKNRMLKQEEPTKSAAEIPSATKNEMRACFQVRGIFSKMLGWSLLILSFPINDCPGCPLCVTGPSNNLHPRNSGIVQ